MKFGFVTCVQLGLSCMEEIARLGGHLDLLVTLEDDQSTGKSGRVWLDDYHARHGGTLLKSRSVNDKGVVDAIREHEIDWLFIIGWSQIATSAVLEAPKRGVLGMHPTLLPEGRGRAPIPWAIIKGLKETGVTLFKLDEGVDTGPIIAQERLSIRDDETATSLYRRVDAAHVSLLRSIWPSLIDDTISLCAQDEKNATYWPRRRPEDGEIHRHMTVEEVDRLVRALTQPYPGAYVTLMDSRITISAGARHRPNESTFNCALLLEVSDGLYQIHALRETAGGV